MIKITLNNRKYTLPKRFTIEQWQEILKLDSEDPKSWPYIMAIAFKLPVGKFIMCDNDSLILGTSLIINLLGTRKVTAIRDLTTLTLGEFVDVDVWLTMGAEKYFKEILNVISTKEVKYIDEGLWIIDQYTAWRTSTYRSYAGLFGINNKGESIESTDDWSPQKVAKGWYKVLVDLADNDIMKLDAVTDQPLKKALNFMALRKEKIQDENFKQLQNKRNNDLQRRNK